MQSLADKVAQGAISAVVALLGVIFAAIIVTFMLAYLCWGAYILLMPLIAPGLSALAVGGGLLVLLVLLLVGIKRALGPSQSNSAPLPQAASTPEAGALRLGELAAQASPSQQMALFAMAGFLCERNPELRSAVAQMLVEQR